MRRFAVCVVLSCIVVAPGALALAAPQGHTSYVGKTKQGRAIRLKADARQVRVQSFAVELQCHDGSVLVDQESGFEPSALSGGKFGDTQYGSTDTVTYSGQVRGSKVTGTVKVRDKVGKVKCVSPAVKFTAQRQH